MFSVDKFIQVNPVKKYVIVIKKNLNLYHHSWIWSLLPPPQKKNPPPLCSYANLFPLVLKIQVHMVLVGILSICCQKLKRNTFGKVHRYPRIIYALEAELCTLIDYMWITHYMCFYQRFSGRLSNFLILSFNF